MKFKSPFHILPAVILTIAGEVSQAELPKFKIPEATSAVAVATAAQVKAKADYDKAVLAAKQKLIERLSAILSKTTKSGDLDEAVKLRDKIAAIKVEITVISAGERSVTAFLSPEQVLGDWKVSANSSFTFKKGGFLELHNVSGRGEQQGTWKMNEKSLVCVFKQNGETLTWTFDKLEGDTLSGTREFQGRMDKPSSSNSITITKIPTTTP